MAVKPHPRIRKTVKWGGLVLTALLTVVWIGSGWFRANAAISGGWFAGIAHGIIGGGRDSAVSPSVDYVGTSAQWGSFRLAWAFDGNAAGALVHMRVPLWAPWLIAVAATSIAWRLDTLAKRRARVGACAKCSYDRRGLAAGVVCPECGALPGNEPERE